MPEAVIVATARTPIGRANKGSLTECRPDDLAGFIIKDVLGKVPSLDPQTVEDVILGCGQPGGEAGYNIGRVAALLAGLPDVPGVTVNRYCSSSLQTIRMAAHAIKAGEGDVFIAAGVLGVGAGGRGVPTARQRERGWVTRRRRQPGSDHVHRAGRRLGAPTTRAGRNRGERPTGRRTVEPTRHGALVSPATVLAARSPPYRRARL